MSLSKISLTDRQFQAFLATFTEQNEAAALRVEQRHAEEKRLLVETLAGYKAREEERVSSTQEEKYERVLSEFRKSQKVKEFSPLHTSVNGFISSVTHEARNLALAKGMNIEHLTDYQWIMLVDSKLPHTMSNQLVLFCQKIHKTVQTVSWVKFLEFFRKNCGKSSPMVTSVMKLYGPDRPKKEKTTEMITHTLDFKNKLPACMLPDISNLEELQKFVDLMQRTAFFASIDEPEIRKALLKLPEDQTDFEEFTKVAVETDNLISSDKSTSDAINKVDGQQQEAAASSVLQVQEASALPVMKTQHSYNYNTRDYKPRGRSGYSPRGRGSNNRERRGNFRYGRGPNTKSDTSTSPNEFTCFSCGGKGHKSPVCPSFKTPSNNATSGNIGARSVDIVQQNIDRVVSPSNF